MPPSRQRTPAVCLYIASSPLSSLSAADSNVLLPAEPGLAFPFRPPAEKTLASLNLFRATDSFSLTIQNA
jgi:hypothetical protein